MVQGNSNFKKAIPPDAPQPKLKEVYICLYVYSDHSGYKLTRQSSTGFIIFMNTSIVQWLSKKQSTIETSVFGAEFVAQIMGWKDCVAYDKN